MGNSDLIDVFGLTKQESGGTVVIGGETPLEAFCCVDIQRFHNALMYSNIVAPSLVVDRQVPLLRAFSLKSSNQRPLGNDYHQFEHIEYKRVTRYDLQNFTIEFRSEQGNPIPFLEIGVTRVCLHFCKDLPAELIE